MKEFATDAAELAAVVMFLAAVFVIGGIVAGAF